MNTEYLTLRELVQAVDIPENTCKRYLQEHQRFLDHKKVHNRYMIHNSAVETLLIIRKMYGEGLKRDAVEERLQDSNIPITITVDAESDADFISYNDELKAMRKELREEVRQEMELMREGMKKGFEALVQKSQHDNQRLLQEIAELKQLHNRKEADNIDSLRQSLTFNKEELEKIVEVQMVQNEENKEELAKQKAEERKETIELIKQTVNSSFKEAMDEKMKEQPESKGFFQRLFGK